MNRALAEQLTVKTKTRAILTPSVLDEEGVSAAPSPQVLWLSQRVCLNQQWIGADPCFVTPSHADRKSVV